MTAVLLYKDVYKQLLLAFTLNTCCGCVGSFGCFSKNQRKMNFILAVVGLWPQFHSEKQIITHCMLFNCKYVLTQMNLSEPFYITSLNFKVVVKKVVKFQGSLEHCDISGRGICLPLAPNKLL